MGYDLHITRADQWFDSEEGPIGADEWLRIVEADPELSPVPDNGPYFVLWRGDPSNPAGPWFDWRRGQIFSKYPEADAIAKMIQIASLLDARVVGDDGEEYRLDYHGRVSVTDDNRTHTFSDSTKGSILQRFFSFLRKSR